MSLFRLLFILYFFKLSYGSKFSYMSQQDYYFNDMVL